MSDCVDGVLRVGIAGLGRSGFNIHATALALMTDKFKIVTAADQSSKNRSDAEREFGIQTYEDYTELLEAGGIDLFVNALPTPLHSAGTIAALNAGYHVVSEKPLAGRLEDVDAIIN